MRGGRKRNMTAKIIKRVRMSYKSKGFRGFVRAASIYFLKKCQILALVMSVIRRGRFRKLIKGKPLKLHLGCGSIHLDGYINVDKFNTSADLVMDAWKLNFPDNSVDEIFTSHMVEHMTYPQFMKALEEWKRVLNRGASLIIRCPNFEECLKRWQNADYQKRWGANNEGVNVILGFQYRGPGYVNRNIFTSKRLADLVSRVGFEVIKCHPVMNRYNDIPNGDILLLAKKHEE